MQHMKDKQRQSKAQPRQLTIAFSSERLGGLTTETRHTIVQILAALLHEASASIEGGRKDDAQ